MTHATIPVGSTLTRRYYTVPEVTSIGEEFADVIDANLAALEKWAAVDTDLPIAPPVVDQRWEMTHPDGGRTDFTVERDQVWPAFTDGPFADRAERQAAAGHAANAIRSLRDRMTASAGLPRRV